MVLIKSELKLLSHSFLDVFLVSWIRNGEVSCAGLCSGGDVEALD